MMTKQRNDRPRRIVDPRGHRIPLFVRLCEGFVDNLSQILRVALVAGGIYLVQSLADLRDAMEPAEERAEQHFAEGPPEQPVVVEEIVLDSEVIQLAEDCTRTEYWTQHYDKCFPGGSTIYPRPDPEELDDTGFIFDTRPVLLARLAASGGNQ